MPLALLLALSCAPKAPPEQATEAATAPASTQVTKSPIDGRDYRYVQLDNGLKALLIHDPNTDMAAASLRVDVGHYWDPVDRQGLAHFLEHMLFMGTDRYPDVEDYRRFIDGHGGYSNAGTGGESTGYYFRVEQAHLDGAFDRFARFFVAPTLDPAYVERERKAVHNEYSMKIKQEDRRTRQVRKATTNPDHPEAKFSVGNQDTLGDRGEDVVYEDLRTLYDAWYRADRMTMSVIGRESLDVLEAMVRDDLSEVPGDGPAEPVRPAPFLPEQLGVRIHVTPLQERREVELQFPLPPETDVWPRKPHHFLSRILGHEGPGTLAAAMKEKGYSEWMSASVDGAEDYDLFKINIGLTVDGEAHLDDVVASVFEAIQAVRDSGVTAARYDELAKKATLDFQFAEELTPTSATRSAVSNLNDYPPEHALDAGYQWGAFDAAPIEAALAKMVPSNLRLLVVLPELETDQTEALYDVPYGIRALTEAEVAAFTAADSSLDVALPALNPYLPEDTTLIAGPADDKPVKLDTEGALAVWHMADPSFEVPRVTADLRLYVPLKTTEEKLAAELYGELLDDHMLPFSYPLGEAGLNLYVSVGRRGTYLTLRGYDDRMPKVLADSLDQIMAFEPTQERLDVLKAQLVRRWRNRAFNRPSSQSYAAASSSLYVGSYNRQEQADALEKISLPQVNAYAKRLQGEVGGLLFVHGNMTSEEAQSLATVVTDRVEIGTAPPDPVGVFDLPEGKEIVRDLVIDHNDSSIVIHYVGNFRQDPFQARWALLSEVLKTPFFGQLRTEQQLGYLVRAGNTPMDVWPGMTMAIQSSTTDPGVLQERIDTFIQEQESAIEAMSPEDFASIRAGLIAKLREAETRLYTRTSRLTHDLGQRRLAFDGKEALAKEVELIDQAALLDFYRTAILNDGARLIVRNTGTAHKDAKLKAGCADAACVAKLLGEVRNRPLH